MLEMHFKNIKLSNDKSELMWNEHGQKKVPLISIIVTLKIFPKRIKILRSKHLINSTLFSPHIYF
ncbi:hypothetical protein P9112_008232 [Eukaryota sp. TZLM1-RC]